MKKNGRKFSIGPSRNLFVAIMLNKSLKSEKKDGVLQISSLNNFFKDSFHVNKYFNYLKTVMADSDLYKSKSAISGLP